MTDLGGGVAIKFGAWFLSVAVLNVLVGSPITDVYVGFTIVGFAFYAGWVASNHFDEPPTFGSVVFVDGQERRYLGHATPDGNVEITGPDGRWHGSAWSGSWTVTDPHGEEWHGRVGSKGILVLESEDGRELRGTVTPD